VKVSPRIPFSQKFGNFFFFKKGLFGRRILQHFAKFHPKKRKTVSVLVPQKWLAMCIVEYTTISYAIFCLL